jgi:hypothetical protein
VRKKDSSEVALWILTVMVSILAVAFLIFPAATKIIERIITQ